MSNIQIIQDTRSVADIMDSVKSNIVEGNIDPIQAYAVLTDLEYAIAKIKDDKQVRDIVLRELSKYGSKGAVVGNYVFTQAESGVRYDYSQCGCSRLDELYATKKAIDADIKEVEGALKALPTGGLADPETGEMWYRPTKTSKTIIKTTTKRV